MGASESTLRSAALLLVLDRREEITQNNLDYLKTKEFKNFFSDNMADIHLRSCQIYGLELQGAANNNQDDDIERIIEEINNYCSEPVIELAGGMDNIARTGRRSYIKYIDPMRDFVDFTTLYNSIIGGNKDLYDKIKEYDGKSIKTTEFHVYNQVDKSNKNIANSSSFFSADINEQFKLAILRATVELISDPSNAGKLYILKDIIEHIKMKNYFSDRSFNNLIQNISENVKLGKLNDEYDWAELPIVSREKQRAVFKSKLNDIFSDYPKIGYFDNLF